jgi:hypothetical protein
LNGTGIQGFFNDQPILEGYASAQQDKKQGCRGHEPQGASQDQEHDDQLAGCRKVGSCVHHHQPGHTDGRCGGKEGVDNAYSAIHCSKWQRKQQRACQDHRGEAAGQVTGRGKRSITHHNPTMLLYKNFGTLRFKCYYIMNF